MQAVPTLANPSILLLPVQALHPGNTTGRIDRSRGSWGTDLCIGCNKWSLRSAVWPAALRPLLVVQGPDRISSRLRICVHGVQRLLPVQRVGFGATGKQLRSELT
jgi:hypothetical protein